MLSKSFYSLAFLALLFTTEATAQQTFTLYFVDDKTGEPVPEVMSVRASGGSSGPDGKLEVKASPGDTINVMSPYYPIHSVVLTGESSQTVRLSNGITAESVFSVVDETAEYPGGMELYYRFVAKTMRYPAEARRNGIEGRVFVEFIIGADGSIEKNSIRSIHSPSPILSAETERVVMECPPWKPGKKNGKNVRQLMVLPRVFRLR